MKNLILVLLLSLASCQSAYRITTIYTTDSLGNKIKTVKKEYKEYSRDSYIEVIPYGSTDTYFYPRYRPQYVPYYGQQHIPKYNPRSRNEIILKRGFPTPNRRPELGNARSNNKFSKQ